MSKVHTFYSLTHTPLNRSLGQVQYEVKLDVYLVPQKQIGPLNMFSNRMHITFTVILLSINECARIKMCAHTNLSI